MPRQPNGPNDDDDSDRELSRYAYRDRDDSFHRGNPKNYERDRRVADRRQQGDPSLSEEQLARHLNPYYGGPDNYSLARKLERRSIRDVARELGIDQSTLNRRYRRLMKAVRKKLTAEAIWHLVERYLGWHGGEER